VACVSWEDASAFVRWLSQKTGKGYRLLTEAEWEYAARAGTATTRFWGDAGNRSCGYANGADLTAEAQVPDASNWAVANCNDRYAYTAPVGSYRPNSFGLHDMLGNVWEWTQDCWNGNYSGAPTDGSAWAAGDCSQRMVCGGSWEDAPLGLRAAYRVGSPTVIRVYARGFRVARDD
jgi:formylglycine-generating enzyme required for sulfatase activity